MSDQPDEILTIDEVAAYLKVGKRTVYRLAASGKDCSPMHEVNQTPPDRMTPKQRRDEVAYILALGLARLRMGHSPSSEKDASMRDISLGFSGQQSVHSDPVNYR